MDVSEINDRLDRVIDAADRLSDLLKTENAAIGRRDTDTIRALVEEKKSLVTAYEGFLQPFRDTPELLKMADADVRADLKEASEHLADLLRENGRLLAGAVVAGRMVVDMIVEAAREKVPTSKTYGADGVVGKTSRRKPAGAVALDGTF